MQEIKMFDIKEFVKKQKEAKLAAAGIDGNDSNPFGGTNPFMNPGNPFGGGFPPINSDTNIDEMIKQIDAKIAELEKEEEEERKKQDDHNRRGPGADWYYFILLHRGIRRVRGKLPGHVRRAGSEADDSHGTYGSDSGIINGNLLAAG